MSYDPKISEWGNPTRQILVTVLVIEYGANEGN